MSETRSEEPKIGSNKWIDVFYDPVASLNTFSQCMTLSDINADGDVKLVIADLGKDNANVKLKVYKGTSLISENTFLDLPTSIATFYLDLNEPRTPAIAVASGPFIYVYKNLRPYFKFTLPSLDIDPTEQDTWNRLKENKIKHSEALETLDNLRAKGVALTVQSLKLLDAGKQNYDEFILTHKDAPLKRQTAITCMDTLKKSMAVEDAISCLVIGTESRELYVLDPEAFTVLAQMKLPAVPVFLETSGLFDVEFTVLACCRNGGVYAFKRGTTAGKLLFQLTSQPVGMLRLGKSIVVGCMDETLQSYSFKGKRLWCNKLPSSVITMEIMDHQARGIQAVLVSLSNNEVHTYLDKNLVDIMTVESTVTAMKFGKFGREDSTLVMAAKGGGLIIKVLKRTAQFDNRHTSAGPPTAQNQKLDIPKKTKLFLDQTIRERENGVEMYRQFQQDLYRLRLETARNYVTALQKSMTPVSVSQAEPVKLHAEVTGIGPVFKLSVGVQNTSMSQTCYDLYITFDYDHRLYELDKPLISMPMLVPGLNYVYDTLLRCLSDKGISDVVKVFVLKKSSPVPVISALINMPVSEAVIVV